VQIYSLQTTDYHQPEQRIRIGAQKSNSSHLIAAVKRESVWGVLPRAFATFAISEMILFFSFSTTTSIVGESSDTDTAVFGAPAL
jgi:hypothetical protein